MAKKINRDELLDVFTSDIPGAVIISADTHNHSEVFIALGAIGVKTYIGCVEFGAGDSNDTYNEDSCEALDCVEGIMCLSSKKCREIFNDVPPDGTAWLVIPREKDYVWERIDHLLKFQNEAKYIKMTDEVNEHCDDAVSGADEVEALYSKRLNLRVGEKV